MQLALNNLVTAGLFSKTAEAQHRGILTRATPAHPDKEDLSQTSARHTLGGSWVLAQSLTLNP